MTPNLQQVSRKNEAISNLKDMVLRAPYDWCLAVLKIQFPRQDLLMNDAWIRIHGLAFGLGS